MINEKVDLYKYFGLEKPEGAKGELTLYIHDQSKEYCLNRYRPAMLVIPGGGYGFVSDRENEPIALKFLESDFNVFALNYSVAPVKYPYPLLEGAMAMIFIRQNAEKYHIDKNHVGAIGFSAGGHLTGMLGTIFDEKVILDMLKVEPELIRPDAIVLSYPVITSTEKAHIGSFNNLCGDDVALKKYLSLEERVTDKSSPAFIWGTVGDNGVPMENGYYMAGAYRNAGVPFEYHLFEKGVHGLSLANEEVNSPEKRVAKWVKLCLSWLKEERGFKFFDV